MISIVALKFKQVFNFKLITFIPTNLKTLIWFTTLFFKFRRIQKIKDLFIINLQKGTRYWNMFCFFDFLYLSKSFSYSSDRQAIIHIILYR